MRVPSATLHAILLMGLATTPLLCVSPAAAQDVAASASAGQPTPAGADRGAVCPASAGCRVAQRPDVAKAGGSLPVLAEHRYRMLAKVRPLLFWISRDDVGGARITWRGDEGGDAGYELLIGSDPAKAPRRINRWGYIAEQSLGSHATVLGVMKQSNEKSIEEAQTQIGASGTYVFKAIRASAAGSQATAGVTTVRASRDFTYHDLEALLDLVSSAEPDAAPKATALAPGAQPGFLMALATLIQGSVRARGVGSPKPLAVAYIYNGGTHDLKLRDTEFLTSTTIDHRQYADVIRGGFETRSRATGESTRFEVTYGAAGALAGVPVHAVYQPRWWFEVQLFLDDSIQF